MWVSQVVSFLQAPPPKPCISLSCPPYALHAPPIFSLPVFNESSFFLSSVPRVFKLEHSLVLFYPRRLFFPIRNGTKIVVWRLKMDYKGSLYQLWDESPARLWYFSSTAPRGLSKCRCFTDWRKWWSSFVSEFHKGLSLFYVPLDGTAYVSFPCSWGVSVDATVSCCFCILFPARLS